MNDIKKQNVYLIIICMFLRPSRDTIAFAVDK